MAANTSQVAVAADTEIDSGNPATNYGSSQTIQVGTTPGFPSPKHHRAVMEFDVSTILPAGATLASANLRLWVNTAGSTAVETRWYRMTQAAWVEMQATWDDYKTATAWVASGGDYDATMYAASLLPIATGYDTIMGLRTLVQDAIDNRSGHLLLLGMLHNIGLAQTCVYASREDPNPTRRPLLQYSYATAAQKGIGFQDRLMTKALGAAKAYSFSGLRRTIHRPYGLVMAEKH